MIQLSLYQSEKAFIRQKWDNAAAGNGFLAWLSKGVVGREGRDLIRGLVQPASSLSDNIMQEKEGGKMGVPICEEESHVSLKKARYETKGLAVSFSPQACMAALYRAEKKSLYKVARLLQAS